MSENFLKFQHTDIKSLFPATDPGNQPSDSTPNDEDVKLGRRHFVRLVGTMAVVVVSDENNCVLCVTSSVVLETIGSGTSLVL